MFGGKKRSQARFEALQTNVSSVQLLLAQPDVVRAMPARLYLTDLEVALNQVIEDETLITADGFSELVAEAVRLSKVLQAELSRAARLEKTARDAAKAKLFAVKDQQLRACPCCHGREFLLRERVSFELWNGSLQAIAVVCVTCGDIRFRTVTMEAIKEMESSDEYRRVELAPVTSGPYR